MSRRRKKHPQPGSTAVDLYANEVVSSPAVDLAPGQGIIAAPMCCLDCLKSGSAACGLHLKPVIEAFSGKSGQLRNKLKLFSLVTQLFSPSGGALQACPRGLQPQRARLAATVINAGLGQVNEPAPGADFVTIRFQLSADVLLRFLPMVPDLLSDESDAGPLPGEDIPSPPPGSRSGRYVPFK